jgi:hypothetical protein
MKKKVSKRRKGKKFSKTIFAILMLFIIAILVLSFLEFNAADIFKKKEVVYINIVDGCSLVMNVVLHQIRDDSDCSNSCLAKCYIIEKEYYESKFTENPEGCHECECYCK